MLYSAQCIWNQKPSLEHMTKFCTQNEQFLFRWFVCYYFFWCKAPFSHLRKVLFKTSYSFITLANPSLVSNWLLSAKWLFLVVDSKTIDNPLFPKSFLFKVVNSIQLQQCTQCNGMSTALNVSRSLTVKVQFVFFWGHSGLFL